MSLSHGMNRELAISPRGESRSFLFRGHLRRSPTTYAPPGSRHPLIEDACPADWTSAYPPPVPTQGEPKANSDT